MDPRHLDTSRLIDAIVQRTMALIAQLATADGARAPLAHIANQVFYDLITELEAQGVRRKVVADMFGLALRSYQKRVQRLAESRTDAGRSLWEAVLQHLSSHGVTTRLALLERFRHDDDATVRGILQDLVESGLVFKTGSGERTSYVAADRTESEDATAERSPGAASSLVWLVVYRQGPLTLDELAERMRRVAPDELARLVAALVAEGRVQVATGEDGVARYQSRHLLAKDARAIGWETAVLDHFEAVVTTLCRSLAKSPSDPHARAIGGSTYSFDLWPEHPHATEVLAGLARIRAETTALREKVTAWNEQHAAPDPQSAFRVTFYAGQTVSPQLHEPLPAAPPRDDKDA